MNYRKAVTRWACNKKPSVLTGSLSTDVRLYMRMPRHGPVNLQLEFTPRMGTQAQCGCCIAFISRRWPNGVQIDPLQPRPASTAASGFIKWPLHAFQYDLHSSSCHPDRYTSEETHVLHDNVLCQVKLLSMYRLTTLQESGTPTCMLHVGPIHVAQAAHSGADEHNTAET